MKLKPAQRGPLPLTVTSRDPRAAPAATVTFALITVSLIRTAPVAVTPLPEKVTLYVRAPGC